MLNHWDGKVYFTFSVRYYRKYTIIRLALIKCLKKTNLGLVGCLWFAAWIFIVKDRPENDKKMSADELRYITSSLASTMSKDKIKHPWKKILTSAPVFALCAANFTENWATYTLLTQLPTFLKGFFYFYFQILFSIFYNEKISEQTH